MKRRRIVLAVFLPLLMFMLLFAGAASAATFFVNQSAPPGGDGSSWGTALNAVQAGINAAGAGDEVWVAQGTYYENITLKDGVGLYGGFDSSGYMDQLNQRDWKMYETILDGRKLGSVVTIAQRTTSATIIDGFTIRNGSGTNGYGGGVYLSDDFLSYYVYASPRVSNNKITGNTGTHGAGIYTLHASMSILNNEIVGNNASGGYGGGIFVESSQPQIPSPVISGNLISGNTAYDSAGIYSGYCNPVISNNVVSNNASSFSAGISLEQGTSAIVQNNLITGNTSSGMVGAVYAYNLDVTLVNNTIVGNHELKQMTTDANQAGAVRLYNCTGTIANNIIAYGTGGINNDTPATAPSVINNDVVGNPDGDYLGITPGTGNLSLDPLFIDNLAGNFHIRPDSPCVNHGDNTFVQAGATDIDGEARIKAGIVDIGADEAAKIVYVSNRATGAHDGSSWGTAFLTVQEGLNAASAGDFVWVGSGQYLEHVSIATGVQVYGGFAGTETTLSQRDYRLNETILDGKLSAGSVVWADRYTRVDGFTIQNGEAGGSVGGGIRAYLSVYIANNIIKSNKATGGLGGGVSLDGAGIAGTGGTVTNNLFVGNTAGVGGALLSVSSDTSYITGNTFRGNTTDVGLGGAIGVWHAMPTVANNVFDRNLAGYYGKGHAIGLMGGSSSQVANNTISGDPAALWANGSMIYFEGSTGSATNNIMAYNAGGLKVDSGSTVTAHHNAFFRVTSPYLGGVASTGGDVMADPQFNDLLAGDLHLKAESPCIDAGDNTVITAGGKDIDGEARVNLALGAKTIDIGADEFYYPVTVMSKSGTAGLNGWFTGPVTATLSAIADPQGPAIAATEYSQNGGLTWLPYVSSLSYTQEGLSTLRFRSRDVSGNVEAAKAGSVPIDRTPPVTAINPVGTPGKNGWYVSAMDVYFLPTDNTSGVASTAYAFDNVTWYGGSGARLDAQGNNTLMYRSTDVAGLVETGRVASYKIDYTAPVTAASFTGTVGSNGWFVSNVTATFSATDSASGVARKEYSMDGAVWTTSTGSSTVSAEGALTVQYRSEDTAGNLETAKSQPLNIDKTAPVTGAVVSGTAGNNGWFKSSVQITLTGADNASGVAYSEYNLGSPTDNAAWVRYSAPFTISTPGSKTLYFRSKDNAGLLETYKSMTVKIDTAAPSTGITLAGTLSKGWYTTAVTVTLTATDNGSSGVASRMYYTSDNVTPRAYTSAFSYNREGNSTLYYYAIDNAGNQEPMKSKVIQIDRSAPSVVSSTPANNATNVDNTVTIIVTYTEEIQINSLNAITLKPPTGSAVTIVVTANGKALTITHAAQLNKNNQYTLSLGSNAVKDLAGKTSASSTLKFTTKP